MSWQVPAFVLRCTSHCLQTYSACTGLTHKAYPWSSPKGRVAVTWVSFCLWVKIWLISWAALITIGDSAWSNIQNLGLVCGWLWVGFLLSITCWSSVWGIFCSLFWSLVFRLWGWHEKGEERAVSQQGQWCCTSYIIFVECFAFSSNTKSAFWLPPRYHRHFMVPSLAHGVKGTFPYLCERLLARGGWFSWSCHGAGCQDPEIKRCRKGVEMWQA